MTTSLLFNLLLQFFFVLAFLTFLVKLNFLLELSTVKRQTEDMVRGQEPYSPASFH